MIVDTSALVAILRHEPEDEAFTRVLAQADRVAVSAATLVEAYLVAGPLHPELDELIAAAEIVVAPFDAAQSQLARRAHADYGRGSGSPARLSLGDCFSYALATATRRPLLFTGDAFTHTDVTPAL